MVNTKDKSIVKTFKKQISVIIVLISIVVISVLSLLFINAKSGYSSNLLINALGRQRMFTQVIAKDANQAYQLYMALEQEQTEEQLILTLQELKETEAQYESQYLNIKQGYITSGGRIIKFKNALDELEPVLKQHENIWPDFKKSIDVILNNADNSAQFIDAVNYINEYNDDILRYSDEITTIILNYNNSRNMSMLYFVIITAIIVLMLLIFFLITLYKNMFLPVNQLYMGMAEIGVVTDGINISNTKERELVPVFSEVKTIFYKLNSLILLIENLNKNKPFKDILNYIFESFSEYIPYTHIGVALIEDNGLIVKGSHGVSSNSYHGQALKKLIGYKVNIRHTSLWKIVETGQERIINDLEEYVKGKPLKEYNKILLEGGIKSSITFPLKNNGHTVGIIFFSSNTANIYTQEHVKFLKTLANSIMLSLEENILFDDMVVGAILSLAMLTEGRDPETGEHLKRMSTYSKLLAEFLSCREKYKDIVDIDYINDIERFSPLHDIGKVAIRDDILLKPGKLTPEEFEIMKTHTVYGANVLKTADANLQKRGRSIFKMAIEIAEGHHEKWDGSGYPYGKKGEEIPLSARIVAVADVLDALTSKRPYKKAFSFEESLDIIVKGSGKHFDPEIVDALLQNLKTIREKYDDFMKKGIL